MSKLALLGTQNCAKSRDASIPTDAPLAPRARALRQFSSERGWPPPDAAFLALVDLGLSDEQLGLYFWVEAEFVKRYRDQIGIP